MDNLQSIYEEIADKFMGASPAQESKTLIDESVLSAMRENFIYVPGDCDVLTTYLPIDDQPFLEWISSALKETTPVFPRGFPYYFVPPSAYHISLVMLHDLRPVDMNKDEMMSSVLSDDDIEEVKGIIDEVVTTPSIKEYDHKVLWITLVC